jgi:hypothetical protein
MVMADQGFNPDEMLKLDADTFFRLKNIEEFEKWIRNSSLKGVFAQDISPQPPLQTRPRINCGLTESSPLKWTFYY